MKSSKVVIYILGLIGLYIALLSCMPLASLLIEYSSVYLANLIYIVFYGLLFYLGNKILCAKYLETVTSVKIAYVFVFIFESLFFVFFDKTGFVFTAVSLYVSFEPVIHRQKEIKIELNKQVPCICSYCGQTNDYDAVFCTNCGSGLVHNGNVSQKLEKNESPAQNIYKCKYCQHTFRDSKIPEICPKCKRSLTAPISQINQNIPTIEENKPKTHKFFNIWMIILPLVVCYFTGKLFLAFFSEALPDRDIVTYPVKLTTRYSSEEKYANLVVSISDDEDGMRYTVKSMINSYTGTAIEADSNYTFMGSSNHFTVVNGLKYAYDVTVDYKDLQVSFYERLESHPVWFVLSLCGLLIGIALLIVMINQEVHRVKSQ